MDGRSGSDTDPAVQSTHANAFVRFWRKVYWALGFKRGYNFPLFVIFAGALMGFTLARFQYLDIAGIYAANASPGEWFWYGANHYRIGITMHLAAIMPTGFLVCFQFVPVIRHNLLIFHRINGYIIILLLLVTNAGALMIARRAFGGELSTQAGVGLLAIVTTLAVFMAYYNIKRLQIDQHRAWMLRTWFYAGSIITLRLIMIISALVISPIGNYYLAMPCGQIDSVSGPGSANETYQSCMAGDSHAAVRANFNNEVGNVEEIAGASI